MAKMIENMNGKTMTHKLLGVEGKVVGMAIYPTNVQICLRYVSTATEMVEVWFPLKELSEKVAAKKSPAKKAPATKKSPARRGRKPAATTDTSNTNN